MSFIGGKLLSGYFIEKIFFLSAMRGSFSSKEDSKRSWLWDFFEILWDIE